MASGHHNSTSTVRLRIDGMHCASCVTSIERSLSDVPGVDAANVNLTTATAIVQGHDLHEADLIAAVLRVGYTAEPISSTESLAQQRSLFRQRS